MGLINRLVRLANALSEAETARTRTGEIGGSGGRIDYTMAFDTVGSEQTRQQTHRPKYLTNVRKSDDGLIVAVDLPDVSEDNLSVTYDTATNTVVVRDANRPVKRLGLEWDNAVIKEATYNNHVLELRIGGRTRNG